MRGNTYCGNPKYFPWYCQDESGDSIKKLVPPRSLTTSSTPCVAVAMKAVPSSSNVVSSTSGICFAACAAIQRWCMLPNPTYSILNPWVGFFSWNAAPHFCAHFWRSGWPQGIQNVTGFPALATGWPVAAGALVPAAGLADAAGGEVEAAGFAGAAVAAGPAGEAPDPHAVNSSTPPRPKPVSTSRRLSVFPDRAIISSLSIVQIKSGQLRTNITRERLCASTTGQSQSSHRTPTT